MICRDRLTLLALEIMSNIASRSVDLPDAQSSLGDDAMYIL